MEVGMAEQLIPYTSGTQYTGSNGAAILAEIPAQQRTDYNIHIVSESGGTLVLSFDDAGPTTCTAATGDWVIWSNGRPQIWPDALVAANFVKRSDLL